MLKFALILVLVFAGSVCWAGPVLDDLLNYPVVDAKCPSDTIKEEGLGLIAQKKAAFITLSSEQPLGQTFEIGESAAMLWRVCVGLGHWPDSWQEGEEVTFTLYDSPSRTTRLYSKTLDFDRKWSKWDIAFDLHLPVKPGTSAYWELTHNGAGDNSINVVFIERDEYAGGTAFVSGKARPDIDLYFVTITKPGGDRTANLDRLISRFDLSHKDMAAVKAAADRGDRDAACRALVGWFDAHMKNADWAWHAAPGKYDKRMDRVVADGRLYDDDSPDHWIPTSPETTWREVWPGTSEYVRMNDLFAALGHAYAATGDDRFAGKLDELLADYMQDNASPYEGGMRGGRWVAMFQAWRLGDAWDGTCNAIASPALSADVKLAWLDYWARMAHFASTEHSGGNHANAVAEALMRFATRFPVFVDSKSWFGFGWDKLVSNSLTLFRDDGGCVEPAMNYHGFSLANLQSGLATAREFGMEPPAELVDRLEKALAYTAYMLKPDGTVPSYGDTNCEDFRAGGNAWDGWRNGEAREGATRFGRSDLLYISTAGRKGTRPPTISYRFPDTGHYILRSDWGGPDGEAFEDARFLFLRGGRAGSHGHDDLNSVTLYAYGRPLLIDPGRTTYGTPLMFELSRNRSHNVLLVDDLPMNHSSPTLNAWHTTAVMDCADNSYAGLYPGVDHRRAVIFARPDYYVVFDRATADAPHTFGINFWLPPPAVTVDESRKLVHTNEPAGANVIVESACDAGLALAQRKGTLDLADRLWEDVPVVTFQRAGVSSADFATLLYPFAGKAEPDAVRVREFTVAGGLGCTVSSPTRTDVIAYCWDSGSARLPGVFEFEGRACLARLADSSYTMLGGRKLVLRGTVIASADRPVDELCVEYAVDSVIVTCPTAEPTLELATRGRAEAVVNGRRMPISGDRFLPFR